MRVVPSTGSAELSSAGHPPSILVTSQTATLVIPTGALLFLDPSTEYESVNLELGPGDAIVLFSDGVADVQRSANGRTEPEALAEMLVAERGVATRTADLVLGFADAEPSDDQTVVVLRRSL
jgi:sigma-B regulation protein RsbU (phosphoserine phosphatase)